MDAPFWALGWVRPIPIEFLTSFLFDFYKAYIGYHRLIYVKPTKLSYTVEKWPRYGELNHIKKLSALKMVFAKCTGTEYDIKRVSQNWACHLPFNFQWAST